MFFNLTNIIYLYLRPLIKWFLRRFTRLCELQRICYGQPAGAPRAKAVETSLNLSRRPPIISMVKNLNYIVQDDISDRTIRERVVYSAVLNVVKCKKINSKIHPDFAPSFRATIEQIWGYKRLFHTVEMIRVTPYNSDDLSHEEKLLELWDLLMPNECLEQRVTKQWQCIGFQGDDPKTDFRGMGMLGLDNLVFFCREYNGAARHVLAHSNHPVHGYTFAIVGINLTSMAYNLLRSGAARTHFYNLRRQWPNVDDFHKFYCYLFFEFDHYWMECKPTSIMDFSYINSKFERKILEMLSDDSTFLKMKLFVEDI
ncbi:hypothetical protein HA402_006881 [Bradysia odoriphaga]|nr:hypothetical protein HA402_006881 [Bradysia odoriphaga]